MRNSGASPGPSCPAPLERTARRRLVRVARTYSTEAPGGNVSAQADAEHHGRADDRCQEADGHVGLEDQGAVGDVGDGELVLEGRHLQDAGRRG